MCAHFVHTHRSYGGETRSLVTPEPCGDALEKKGMLLANTVLIHKSLLHSYYYPHHYQVMYCTCSSHVPVICQVAIGHL
jgi:hypothetical protein